MQAADRPRANSNHQGRSLSPMRFSLMTEPQIGGTYDEILAAALWAEDNGLASFARSDHYYSGREPQPDATDALTTLAGLARDTSTIRLSVLVTPLTFRHPAVLAKTAATLDQMSGGRFDLGVGTGWMEIEHKAFGLPFPEWSLRFERLTEALEYLGAAFSGSHAQFTGSYFHLDATVRPVPANLRMIVGGSGKKRTPTLAGIHAHEYNHFVSPPPDIAPKVQVMRAAAEAAGRNPDDIVVSIMGPVFVGRDRSEYDSALARGAASRDMEPQAFEDRLVDTGIPHGHGDELAERFAKLKSIGVGQYYFQWLELSDMTGIDETYEALKTATSGL